MVDCMVDIEAMSSESNAAIVQIGAVAFDPNTDDIYNEFSVNIDLKDAMKYGVVSADTIYWWFSQNDDVRKSITINKQPLWKALASFGSFYKSNNCKALWSHTTYDAVVLINAYKATDTRSPFHYRDTADLRTLNKIENEAYKSNRLFEETKNTQHVAINDARRQAIFVQESYKIINARKQ